MSLLKIDLIFDLTISNATVYHLKIDHLKMLENMFQSNFE